MEMKFTVDFQSSHILVSSETKLSEPVQCLLFFTFFFFEKLLLGKVIFSMF